MNVWPLKYSSSIHCKSITYHKISIWWIYPALETLESMKHGDYIFFFPQPWGIFGQTRNSDSGGPVMTGPRSHYGILSIMLVIIVRYVSLICINHWVWIIVRNYEVPLFVVESSLTFVPTTSMSLYHQDFISMNMWNAFCGIRTIHN